MAAEEGAGVGGASYPTGAPQDRALSSLETPRTTPPRHPVAPCQQPASPRQYPSQGLSSALAHNVIPRPKKKIHNIYNIITCVVTQDTSFSASWSYYDAKYDTGQIIFGVITS
jgi:hypothetical protein